MAMSDLFIGIEHEKALELVEQLLEYSCEKVSILDRDVELGVSPCWFMKSITCGCPVMLA